MFYFYNFILVLCAISITQSNAQNELLTNTNLRHNQQSGTTFCSGDEFLGWKWTTSGGASTQAGWGRATNNDVEVSVLGLIRSSDVGAQDNGTRFVWQDVEVRVGQEHFYNLRGKNYGSTDSRLFVEYISEIGGSNIGNIVANTMEAQSINGEVIHEISGSFIASQPFVRIGFQVSAYEFNATANRDFISFNVISASLLDTTAPSQPQNSAHLGEVVIPQPNFTNAQLYNPIKEFTVLDIGQWCTHAVVSRGYLITNGGLTYNHKYGGGVSAWQLFDSDNPSVVNPTLVGRRSMNGFKTHAAGFSGNLTQIRNSGFSIIDITDMEQPKLATIQSLVQTSSHSSWYVGKYMYLGGEGYGEASGKIDIFKLVNGTTSVHIKTLDMPTITGFRSAHVQVIGNVMFVTANLTNGIASFDVSDPENPIFLDVNREDVGAEYYTSYWYNDKLYAGSAAGGLFVFDVSNPRDIVFANSLNLPGQTRYLTIKDEIIHLTNSSEGAYHRIAISGSNINLLHTQYGFPGADNVIPIGNLMFMSRPIGTTGANSDVCGWLFAHETLPDDKGPEFKLTHPSNDETNVGNTSIIGIAFSEQLNPPSVNDNTIYVREAGGNKITGIYSNMEGVVNFCPDIPLKNNTQYEIVVEANGIEDLIGNATLEQHITTFTTGGSFPAPNITYWGNTAGTSSANITNTNTSFLATTSLGNNGALTYSYDFGDGSSLTSTNPQVNHTYTSPGRYLATVTVIDAMGLTATATHIQIVYNAVTQQSPVQSSEMAIDPNTQNLWVVIPDGHNHNNDFATPAMGAVACINTSTQLLTQKIDLGAGIQAVSCAHSPTEQKLFVSCRETVCGMGELIVINTATNEIFQRIQLGYGALPHGVVVAPNGQSLYIALEGYKSVRQYSTSALSTHNKEWLLEESVRGLSVSANSQRIFATVLISPDRGGIIYELYNNNNNTIEVLANTDVRHNKPNGTVFNSGDVIDGWQWLTYGGQSNKTGWGWEGNNGAQSTVLGFLSNDANAQDAGQRYIWQDVEVEVGKIYNFSLLGRNFGASDSRIFVAYINTLAGSFTSIIESNFLEAQNINSIAEQEISGQFTASSKFVRVGFQVYPYEFNPNAARNFISYDVHSASLTTAGNVSKITLFPDTTTLDNSSAARGLPNYLTQAVISPDGQKLWVPAKKDNIFRGPNRDGNDLNHENTVRALVGQINLSTRQEMVANRNDIDDSHHPVALCFSKRGDLVFAAMPGGEQIAVINTYNGDTYQAITTADQGTFVGYTPTALCISDDGNTLFVHNYLERSVRIFNIQQLVNGKSATANFIKKINLITNEPLEAKVLKGKQLFHNSLDPRLALDNYMSCASCHIDGGHDGRIWDFGGIFGEGIRNTIDLRGRAGMEHGPLHWTANFDEIQDFENQIRTFSGGSGLIENAIPYPPLAQPNAGRSSDLDALAAYVNSLKNFLPSPYRTPQGSLSVDAKAGLDVFNTQNCGTCHGGPKYTDSQNGNVHNIGTIKPHSGITQGNAIQGFDSPTLINLWNSAPYLHDGSAKTIEAAIQAHNGINIAQNDMDKLVAFLKQLTSYPQITQQPQNKTVCAGENSQFSVAAIGTGLNYQWQWSSDSINVSGNAGEAGNNTSTITISNTNAYFRVTITNSEGCSTYSNWVNLTAAPDSDYDGICDAQDQCPGFDDTIDTDNDNLPDGCDDCLPVLTELNNTNIVHNKQAANIIKTNGILIAGNNVQYQAGQQVELFSGFEVQLGAAFDAFIEGCE